MTSFRPPTMLILMTTLWSKNLLSLILVGSFASCHKKRDVAVRCSGGKTVVSIREFFYKDGKQVLSPKWINLSPDQWSTFRKNIPVIEEAITKIGSRLRRVFQSYGTTLVIIGI
ncbi:hypothetical protein RND81_04G101500 [Saponaria officinalis]|uniref:Transcriptional coactivator p15 (PC4) C-terminal domain-containing protein n=1 Tax=Saponaria officinalis TaxID=3572 RepID=A0AAW1LGD5_SAPOF